jgi:hypothetical protein
MRPAYPGKNFPGQGKRGEWEKSSRNAAKGGSMVGLVGALAILLPGMMR